MRVLLRLATAVLFCGIVLPTEAHADPITRLSVGVGWTDFFFGGRGSSWDRAFSLSTLGPTRITVTDFALSGDQFLVSIGGTGAGTGSFSTSQPTSVGDFTANRDFAAADPRWSTGTFFVSAGEYVVSGTATLSPFGGGVAAIRADTAPVPEPGLILLVGSGMIGAVVARRRAKRAGVGDV